MRDYKLYCDNIENVENYDKANADGFKGWECHHRLETHNSDGERRLVNITLEELIALDMRYNRPPEELIFLTKSEHCKLHHIGNKNMKGKHHSEEARKKISDSMKGERNPMKGKHLSEETKQKMAETIKRKKCYIGNTLKESAYDFQ